MKGTDENHARSKLIEKVVENHANLSNSAVVPGCGATVAVAKSKVQNILEVNGCSFRGQERLDAHEIDPTLPCSCGRPNKAALKRGNK